MSEPGAHESHVSTLAQQGRLEMDQNDTLSANGNIPLRNVAMPFHRVTSM